MKREQYHYRVAVPHYVRACTGRPYQAIALLLALWSTVEDPFEEAPFVRATGDDLAWLVPTAVRLRLSVAELIAVDAIKRVRGGYVLHKPALVDLDAPARALLGQPGNLRLSDAPRKTVAERDAIAERKRERVEAQRAASDGRREALARIEKKPSDIRNALARIGQIKPNTLKFSGRGSGAVQAAIDWIAATEATHKEFATVCVAAYGDKGEDKPAKLELMFTSKHDAFLQRIVAQVKG